MAAARARSGSMHARRLRPQPRTPARRPPATAARPNSPLMRQRGWTGSSTAPARPRTIRRLGEDEVDRIVWAMVVAGLENAVELPELAMEETAFGVFEDKVLKNYIATEFLLDYLKDKRSVGVIAEDPERGIQYVAEPIGVVLALTPITNPTSTVLFKAIVAAKTRNAMCSGRRRAPRAARERAVELLQEAGEAAGSRRCAAGVPGPTLDVSQYLFHHPGVDFIWTTGGPRRWPRPTQAGKPLSVSARAMPRYIHAAPT